MPANFEIIMFWAHCAVPQGPDSNPDMYNMQYDSLFDDQMITNTQTRAMHRSLNIPGIILGEYCFKTLLWRHHSAVLLKDEKEQAEQAVQPGKCTENHQGSARADSI